MEHKSYFITLTSYGDDDSVETITLPISARNGYDATHRAVVRAHRSYGWRGKPIHDVSVRRASDGPVTHETRSRADNRVAV